LIAAEQIRAEEKQRIGGFLPDFYTSYVYNGAPLTTKQKFSLATRGTFDPVAMLGVALAAGIEQANNSYAGYGQGAAGYGKRFAAKFVDGRSSDYLTHAVFPALLHQGSALLLPRHRLRQIPPGARDQLRICGP
jgi:hypothetical protein